MQESNLAVDFVMMSFEQSQGLFALFYPSCVKLWPESFQVSVEGSVKIFEFVRDCIDDCTRFLKFGA
jgi:hypothetical protein